jgi:hypothetical protein
MSLTDTQITDLCAKMRIPLGGVFFKDELPSKLEMNKGYFINMEDSVDENGNENDGSHWCFTQIRKYPNDSIEGIYFDPYGQPPPENVKKIIKSSTGKTGIPYTEKDVQSLMNNACGFFCCAIAHYINASVYRTNDLYTDVSNFMEMFDDLNKSIDFKKNEFILKHFFRAENPKLRKEIDVIKPIESISSEDEKGGLDAFKTSVEIKMMPKT